jgi:hypothetical protein
MIDPLTTSTPDVSEPPHLLRVESGAIYAALVSGAVGAVVGIIIGIVLPPLPLSGEWSFGTLVAIAAGVTAVVWGAIQYWRIRQMPGQEWRQALPAWTFTVNTIAVVLVHGVLAVLGALLVFFVLRLGFVGMEVEPFWAAVLMAVVLGLSAYLTSLSVSRMTTQRMSSLLMSFVGIGTLTAMVTAPDPDWWRIHFSHLGTFWSVSGATFNGTLVVGGILVTAFAVYLANDLRVLVHRGVLARANGPRVVSAMFIVMGIMLAGVGLVPVNLSVLVHNICASGLAVMYIGLLAAGPWILRGMPRAYFIASWAFLASVVLSTLLFAVGFFGLTAYEIIVFALVFGWISVFIRFLGVADQRVHRN